MTNYNLEEFKEWLAEHETWNSQWASWNMHLPRLAQNWDLALAGKAAYNSQIPESQNLITSQQQAILLQWKAEVDQRERERERERAKWRK